MTIKSPFEPLSLESAAPGIDIDEEFNKGTAAGTRMSSYQGVTWYTDGGATGTFSYSNLKFSDFYNKRKDNAIPPTVLQFSALSSTPTGGITTYSYTIPSGVTQIAAICIGGGGGGGGGSGRLVHHTRFTGGGGGGAGAIASNLIDVSPGQVLTINVARGGGGGVARDGSFSTGSNGADGADSWITIGGQVKLAAKGGLGGQVSQPMTIAGFPPDDPRYNTGQTAEYAERGAGGPIYGFNPSDTLEYTGRPGQRCYGTIVPTTWTYTANWPSLGAYPGTINYPYHYIGGGYGAGGWLTNVNTNFLNQTYFHRYYNTGVKMGSAFVYVVDESGSGYPGVYSLGMQRINPATALSNMPLSSGNGAGGAGGGRDNEYWQTTGSTYYDGDNGRDGLIIIYFGGSISRAYWNTSLDVFTY